MNSPKQLWLLNILILLVSTPVNVQFAFPMPGPPPPLPPLPPPLPPPMFPPPPIFAMPPPMPPGSMFALPPPPPPMNVVLPSFSVQIAENQGEYRIVHQTTTTTPAPQPQHVAIAVPMPMPQPVQIGIPAMPAPQFCQARASPPGCPACPPCICYPSCTPSFFSYCSSCHQKCRCKGENVPVPIPPQIPIPVPGPAYPVGLPPMGPPSVVVLPYPHRRKRVRKIRIKESSSSSSEDSSSSSSSDCQLDSCSPDRRYSLRASRIKHIKHRTNKNNRRSSGINEIHLHPVLSYVEDSDDGEVMKRASSDESGVELKESRKIQRVSVRADKKRPKIIVTSDHVDASVAEKENKRSQYILNSRRSSHHTVQEGMKKIVFKPPENKKISNLSVVFQVS